eukprot:scaffold231580_cov31-Tisochrysis_lutea.AAC.2
MESTLGTDTLDRSRSSLSSRPTQLKRATSGESRGAPRSQRSCDKCSHLCKAAQTSSAVQGHGRPGDSNA